MIGNARRVRSISTRQRHRLSECYDIISVYDGDARRVKKYLDAFSLVGSVYKDLTIDGHGVINDTRK
ncbi:hypothetical protein C8R42DRAFT_690702 [Lentinula raphanica]|nr:hypothetical protein C8R42DRAFT_690702 [Lentinula raphanica]